MEKRNAKNLEAYEKKEEKRQRKTEKRTSKSHADEEEEDDDDEMRKALEKARADVIKKRKLEKEEHQTPVFFT